MREEKKKQKKFIYEKRQRMAIARRRHQRAKKIADRKVVARRAKKGMCFNVAVETNKKPY